MQGVMFVQKDCLVVSNNAIRLVATSFELQRVSVGHFATIPLISARQFIAARLGSLAADEEDVAGWI